MLLIQREIQNTSINISELICYNESSVDQALKIFQDNKEKGIILNNSYHDDEWILFNGTSKHKLNFKFDEITLKKEFKYRYIYNNVQFTNTVKCYILNVFNKKSIFLMYTFILILKKILKNTYYFNKRYINERFNGLNLDWTIDSIRMIIEYLDYVEVLEWEDYRIKLEEDLKYLIKLRQNEKKTNDLNRRELVEFQSMFYFNELIESFWEVSKYDEQNYYYPLYLWWNITTILPLRVTEFLVTPYDCIEKDENGFKIIVRRSTLKGRKKKKEISHNIEDDYSLHKYPISDHIANLILDYRERSSLYNKRKKLLFSLEFFYDMSGYKYNDEMLETRIFSRYSLTSLLKTFYVKVLQNRFGLSIKYKDKECYNKDKEKISKDRILKSGEIMYINPGDTRHIAMINMILNDFNPILVKDFAGHSNVDIAYNYFSNISNIVRCISYEKYKELCNQDFNSEYEYKQGNITGNLILNTINYDIEQGVEVDYGVCISEKFKVGLIDDCKVVGSSNCEGCDYYIQTEGNSKSERERKLKELELEIQREGKLLGDILSTYKESDINLLKKSMLLIQSKAFNYMHILTSNKGD